MSLIKLLILLIFFNTIVLNEKLIFAQTELNKKMELGNLMIYVPNNLKFKYEITNYEDNRAQEIASYRLIHQLYLLEASKYKKNIEDYLQEMKETRKELFNILTDKKKNESTEKKMNINGLECYYIHGIDPHENERYHQLIVKIDDMHTYDIIIYIRMMKHTNKEEQIAKSILFSIKRISGI